LSSFTDCHSYLKPRQQPPVRFRRGHRRASVLAIDCVSLIEFLLAACCGRHRDHSGWEKEQAQSLPITADEANAVMGLRAIGGGGPFFYTRPNQARLVFIRSVMWPIHGEYECRSCGRRHSVPWDARNKMTPQEQALSPGIPKLVLVNSQTSNLRFESRSRHSELPSGTRGA
jgi:hypothetical protein